MQLTIETIDKFHGISHIIGLKITPKGQCRHCKSKTVYFEIKEDEIKQEELVSALETLVGLIKDLDFSEK